MTNKKLPPPGFEITLKQGARILTVHYTHPEGSSVEWVRDGIAQAARLAYDIMMKQQQTKLDD